MQGVIHIAQLTFLDLRRRRIALAAVLCGLACLLVFAWATQQMLQSRTALQVSLLQLRMQIQLLTLAGLSVVNLLTMAVAIVLPLDCISGEIASGVMQTLAVKPIHRSSIVLGKWLAFALALTAYVVMMVLGITVSVRLITGFTQTHVLTAIALMSLEALVLVSVVIAGGTRLSGVANALLAFALYCVAVVGGWVEQIGAVMGSVEARYIGTTLSLLSPTDALWRRALYLLQPPVMSQTRLSPFSPAAVPTEAMVWWAAFFALAMLLLAIRSFSRREL